MAKRLTANAYPAIEWTCPNCNQNQFDPGPGTLQCFNCMKTVEVAFHALCACCRHAASLPESSLCGSCRKFVDSQLARARSR